MAVPATAGSQMKGPCARIDLFKQHAGLDLTKMYPPGAPPDKALTDKWTWDTFLVAAEKCFKAGFPFGIGMGQTADSVDSAGAIFAAYGAQLVDAKGNITVNSDATRQALEYCKRLVQFLPADVFAWDDASNNKWLISGKGALIMNPPSAWAVAKRDNPKVAEQLWTFPAPKGPKGRFQPGPAVLLGHLEVLQEQGRRAQPAHLPVAALGGRAAGRRQRRLRHPGVRRSARLQDLGRGGSAQGHPVPLSAARGSDRVDRRRSGARADRHPDVLRRPPSPR